MARSKQGVLGQQAEHALVRIANDLTRTANDRQLSRDLLNRIFRKTYGGDRDVPEVLGYKIEPGFEDFKARYLRQDIAGRVVDLPVKATWSDEIKVTGVDDKEVSFDFDELKRRLKLTRRFVRVDRLAQLGRYAVMLIGVKGDNPKLSDPIENGSLNDPADIIFLSAYSEPDAKIISFVNNAGDERFGLPETYTLSIATRPGSGGNQDPEDVKVHHSRILHISDSGIKDDIYGTPRLLGILDRLEDLEKVVGGSAEMFWQGAARAIIASIQKDADLGTEDRAALEAAIKKWSHGLARTIVTKGVDVKSLPSATPDPRGIFEVLISLIGARSEIPQRILLGSERGELASTQDRENFAATIRSRRANYAEPIILRALLERLQQFGALKPGEFEIVWPDPLNLSVMDIAEIRAKNASAFKDFSVPGVPDELATLEERRGWLGLPAKRPGGRLKIDLNESDPEVAAGFKASRQLTNGHLGVRNG